jgi:hypothetical protein
MFARCQERWPSATLCALVALGVVLGVSGAGASTVEHGTTTFAQAKKPAKQSSGATGKPTAGKPGAAAKPTAGKPGAAAKPTAGKPAAGAKPVASSPRPSEPAPLEAMPRLDAVHTRGPSGVALVAARMGAAARVAVVTALPAGRWRENDASPGLSEALAAALRGDLDHLAKRTRTGFETAVMVEPDALVVSTTGSREELSHMLDAHAAVLSRPPAGRNEALSEALDRLSRHPRVHDQLEALVYQGYAPYAKSSAARTEGLRKLDGAALVGFARTHAGATGAAIAIVGAIEPVEAIEAMRALELPATPIAPAPTDSLDEQTNQRAAELESDGRGTLRFGWALRGATEHDVAAVVVALELVARRIEVASRSDARRALRHVDHRVDLRTGPSMAELVLELDEGAELPRVRALVEESLSKLGSEQAPAKQLDEARRASVVEALARRGELAAVARQLVRDALRPTARRLEVESRLPSVRAAELQAAAARHLGPLTRSVVVERARNAELRR